MDPLHGLHEFHGELYDVVVHEEPQQDVVLRDEGLRGEIQSDHGLDQHGALHDGEHHGVVQYMDGQLDVLLGGLAQGGEQACVEQ